MSDYSPRFVKIKQELARAIRAGSYAPHEQLPSIAELMKQYAVSDGTVKRALRELVQNGLIYTIAGKGCFASDSLRPIAAAGNGVVAIVYGRKHNEVVGNLFYSAVLRGIEAGLSSRGLGFELVNLQLLSVSELAAAREKGAYPAVVLATRLRCAEAAEIARLGKATVSLFVEYPPISGLYCLANDEHAGARRATEHLFNSGARNVGAIVVPQPVSYAEQRIRGFMDVVQTRCGSFDETLIETGNWSVDSGYLAMQQLLQRHPDLDGVFVANDMMAMGAIPAIIEAGRNIPADVRIIGYDDLEFARFLRPSLSTMRVNREFMGRRAIDILLDRAQRNETGWGIELIQPELVVRQSTAGGRAAALEEP